jgi:hypothetical protein
MAETTFNTSHGKLVVDIAEVEKALGMKAGEFKQWKITVPKDGVNLCGYIYPIWLANTCAYLKRLGVDLNDEAAIRGTTQVCNNPALQPCDIDALVIAAKGFSSNF